MNNNYPTPYTVGKIYHFRYTDKNGKRLRMTTGISRKSDADRFIKEFIDKRRLDIDSQITLNEVIKLYKNPLAKNK
jgi:hypothetical protein